jgi:hypothetical protein
MSWTSDRAFAGALLHVVANSFHVPVTVLLAVLAFRVIFRRAWLAYLGLYVVMVGGSLVSLQLPLLVDNLILVIIWTVLLVILTRLGFFALLATILFSSWYALALTTNPNAWFYHHSVITFALLADWIRTGIDRPRVVRWAAQIAAALDEAHGKGIAAACSRVLG